MPLPMADRGMTGAELKEARLALGLSTAEFARAMGCCNDSIVRKYERGASDVPGPLAVLVGLALRLPLVALALLERARRPSLRPLVEPLAAPVTPSARRATRGGR
jgi:transcriptional regulator with XRE-family HTH domain